MDTIEVIIWTFVIAGMAAMIVAAVVFIALYVF